MLFFVLCFLVIYLISIKIGTVVVEHRVKFLHFQNNPYNSLITTIMSFKRDELIENALSECYSGKFTSLYPPYTTNIMSDYRSLFISKFWSTFCFYLDA